MYVEDSSGYELALFAFGGAIYIVGLIWQPCRGAISVRGELAGDVILQVRVAPYQQCHGT